MRTALTIAGSDSSGGAGIQADIKTMTMNGVFAMSAITALTAQNTTGVTGILNSTPEFLAQQLDAVFTDIYPDAVKIGMVSSQEPEVIARAASQAGVKDIKMYNVSKTHHSYILRDIFRYQGLIVGAPTYNTGLYHEMDVLLAEVANKDIKNHLLGWFGSYGWASKAVAKIQEWNDTRLHFEAVGTPVEMKQALTPETKVQCEALGRAMAERLLRE